MTNAEVIARVRAVYKEEVLSRPSRPVLLEVPSGLLHRFKDAIWKPAATEPWVGGWCILGIICLSSEQ